MNNENQNRSGVPSFEELPLHPLIRWRLAAGYYSSSDKPLNEAFRERIESMSDKEKGRLREQLIQIAESFGSGGP